MGWLQKWDERNQGTANWLADHPAAGQEALPYAKSSSARTTLLVLIGLTMVAWLVFGPFALIPGFIVVAVASRRLEHHPGKDRYKRHGKPD